MSDVSERKPFTIYNLVSALEEFINQNHHSRDGSDRWFAAHLDTEVLPRARRLRSGGLMEDEKGLVKRFRLGEIDKAKAEKQQEIDKLDSEARKLSAA